MKVISNQFIRRIKISRVFAHRAFSAFTFLSMSSLWTFEIHKKTVKTIWIEGKLSLNTVNEPFSFRFCMTTPLLLQFFIGLKTIAIDATYKLNWHGYPLIVLGMIDRKKKFHPLLYACTSGETTNDYSFVFETLRNSIEAFFGEKFQPEILIADGADAIRNAFYQSFDTAKKDIMCASI